MGLLIAYLPVSSQNIAIFSTELIEVFHLFVVTIISVESNWAVTSVLPMGNVNYVTTVILTFRRRDLNPPCSATVPRFLEQSFNF